MGKERAPFCWLSSKWTLTKKKEKTKRAPPGNWDTYGQKPELVNENRPKSAWFHFNQRAMADGTHGAPGSGVRGQVPFVQVSGVT